MRTKKDYAVKRIQNPLRQKTGGRRKSFTGTFWYVVGTVLILFFGVCLYSVLFTDLLKIRFVVIGGTITTAGLKMVTEVMEERKGDHLLFARFSHEREEIAKRLFVRSLRIVRQFPDTIRVIVDERVGAYALVRGEASYTTDQEGFVLSNSALSGLVPLEVPTSTPEVVVGAPYQPEVFRYLKQLLESLRRENGVNVRSIVFLRPPFIDVKLTTDRSWYLLVDITKPASYYNHMLKIFLSKKAMEEKRYQYIDLRIEDTMYWK